MNISVVIPCYNAARWIDRTLRSIFSQDSSIQIIVVDDGSTDGSREIIERYRDRIELRQTKRAGGCAARNAGLRAAKGEIVHFLDADDYTEHNFYKAGRQLFLKHQMDILFFPYTDEHPWGRDPKVHNFSGRLDPIKIFREWLSPRLTPLCGILWRKSFVERIGGWDERLKKFQDGELVLRAMMKLPFVYGSDHGLAVYNAHLDPSVSKMNGPDQVLSEYWSIERLRQDAIGTDFEQACQGLGNRFYSVAQGAYYHRLRTVGSAALKTARLLGVHNHPGTLQHRLACAILGLEGKETLSRQLHLYNSCRRAFDCGTK